LRVALVGVVEVATGGPTSGNTDTTAAAAATATATNDPNEAREQTIGTHGRRGADHRARGRHRPAG
jgi:hypothetical protein